MNIWRMNYTEAEAGWTVAWFETESAANNELQRLKDKYGPSMGPEGVEKVKLPVSVKGMCEWLNQLHNRER